MNTNRFLPAAIVFSSVVAASLQGAIVPFDLLGRGGPGLLPENEPSATAGNTGTGGEVGAGILFNDITLQLTINVAWGSGNGFEDLTGPASAGGHIHLPTPNLPPQSFNESTSVMIGLDGLSGYNPSATNGGFNGAVTLTSAQATALTEGRLYMNFHTATNPGGEIRGNMIQVPEPATASLLLCGMASAFLRSRRRC